MRAFKFRPFIVVLLSLLCSVAVFAESSSDPGLEAVDAAMSSLKTWADLNNWRKHYSPKYDDGYISEGIADFIGTKLANEWNTLPEISAINEKSPKFEDYVISYLTDIIECNQSKIIITNAQNKCPIGFEKLCLKINKKLRDGAAPECVP
jgi:hypothetical protein